MKFLNDVNVLSCTKSHCYIVREMLLHHHQRLTCEALQLILYSLSIKQQILPSAGIVSVCSVLTQVQFLLGPFSPKLFQVRLLQVRPVPKSELVEIVLPELAGCPSCHTDNSIKALKEVCKKVV